MRTVMVVMFGSLLAARSGHADPRAEFSAGVGYAHLPHDGVQDWFAGLGVSAGAGAAVAPSVAIFGRATTFIADPESFGIAVTGLAGPELQLWLHPRVFLAAAAGAGLVHTKYTGSGALGVDARVGCQVVTFGKHRAVDVFVEIMHVSRVGFAGEYPEWHTVTTAFAEVGISVF